MSKIRKRGSKGEVYSYIFIAILFSYLIYTYKALILVSIKLFIVVVAIGIMGVLIHYVFKIIFRNRSKPYELATIDTMDGLDFEKYVACLIKKQGFKNIMLTERYDLGVDIIADKDGERWGIQVKRYSGLVKADAVRQVVTALNIYHCDRSMVVTNSYFSKPAKILAGSNGCILIDRKTLIR